MRGGGEFAEWCCMCERYVRLVVRVPAGGLMYVYLLYMEIPRFQMAWQGAGATGDRAGLAALGNLNVVINGFLRQIITTLEVTTTVYRRLVGQSDKGSTARIFFVFFVFFLAPFPLNFPLSLRVQLCMCMHRSSVGPQGLVIPCLVSSPVHEDPRLCRVRATRMTLRMLQLRHRSLFDQLLKIDMMLVLNLPCLLH